MSRINEILDDLFTEMIKEGDDIARNEYSVAGIDFIFEAEIRPFMDNYNEKLIQEYQEHEDLVAKEIHEREQELEDSKDDSIKKRYWITRDINGVVKIWEQLPVITEDGLWIGNRNEAYTLNESQFPEVELMDIKTVALTILEYGKILETVS